MSNLLHIKEVAVEILKFCTISEIMRIKGMDAQTWKLINSVEFADNYCAAWNLENGANFCGVYYKNISEEDAHTFLNYSYGLKCLSYNSLVNAILKNNPKNFIGGNWGKLYTNSSLSQHHIRTMKNFISTFSSKDTNFRTNPLSKFPFLKFASNSSKYTTNLCEDDSRHQIVLSIKDNIPIIFLMEYTENRKFISNLFFVGGWNNGQYPFIGYMKHFYYSSANTLGNGEKSIEMNFDGKNTEKFFLNLEKLLNFIVKNM